MLEASLRQYHWYVMPAHCSNAIVHTSLRVKYLTRRILSILLTLEREEEEERGVGGSSQVLVVNIIVQIAEYLCRCYFMFG